MTQFARQLEYAGCAERRHSDAAAAAVHLGVTVSGARERESRNLGFGCGGFGRGSGSGGGDGGGGGCGWNLLGGVLLGEVENHVGAHLEEEGLGVFRVRGFRKSCRGNRESLGFGVLEREKGI